MKLVLIYIFFILTSICEAKEISAITYKRLKYFYNKNKYTKGLEIISKIEKPTSTWYKKYGEYKDSKNLYRWKIILMYNSKVKLSQILPEYFHYKSIGGEDTSNLMAEIKPKLAYEYVEDFKSKYEKLYLRKSELEKMEVVITNIFHINTDTISSKNYQDYKRFKLIRDTIIDSDSFNLVEVEQSYNSALKFVKNFTYKGNNVVKISQALTNPFKSEELKVFAIICFIIENVEYDGVLKGGDKQNFIWGTCSPKEILLYKKTVCQGYATLFDSLCKHSNIKSGMIGGDNHAFNWVLLGGIYHILDVTWIDCTYVEGLEYMNENVILNHTHYPKPYKEKLKYIFIDNHFPIYLFKTAIDESYTYDGKGTYTTPYGVFKNETEMTEKFKKLKNDEICNIFGIKRLPNTIEYMKLKSIEDDKKLEVELKKLGII